MERLIESVRKHPCLWNTNVEEYKLNDVRDAAWREVVKECDLPDVKEAKSLWRKLRDGHRQATAKKKRTTGQDSNTKCIWKFEKQMEFILPIMKNRPRTNNATQEDNKNTNKETDDENETQQNEDSRGSIKQEQLNSDSEFIPPRKVAVLSLLENRQNRIEIKPTQRDAPRKQAAGDATRSTSHDTALERFFMSMLLTTSQLPERLQLRVQRQLFNSVMEAKEETVTKKHTQYKQSDFSNSDKDVRRQRPYSNQKDIL